MEDKKISNPILDEIPDACISDEMQKKIKEEFNRMKEMKDLRNQMAQRYSNSLNHPVDVQSLATKYFLNLSSTAIVEKFLSHFVAYSYCMDKALAVCNENGTA